MLTPQRSSPALAEPSPPCGRSPTAPSENDARGFGGVLSPVTFSAQILLASELLRTLSMNGCF